VADTGDNRLLIYDTPLSANSSPVTVIGQASFTQGLGNGGASTASAATLYSPHGVVVDGAGNLWVADRGNCRVLKFKPPFTTGMSASVLIGQSDFTSTGTLGDWGCIPPPSFTPATLESPVAVALDSQGDLWVADESAGRITEYVPPFSNGMAAAVVIGQSNLNDTYPCDGANIGNHGPIRPPTAATLCRPESIVFDSHGNLWVADQSNMRGLEFIPPFSTGMPASLVLGQPNATVFTGGAECIASATTFCTADALNFDASGNLWISDWKFNRVLQFVPPFSTGMAASLEIGQPNFTDWGGRPGDLMNSPTGLTFDANGNLIVTNVSEILVYAPPFSTAMNPATTLTSGPGTCAYALPGPGRSTICEPVGIVAF
jgi:sugar lactone lactonase YvrE